MAFNFLKTGADSVNIAKQAESEAEMRRETQGRMWRFFLGQVSGSSKYDEARITFVDGDLSPEGYLLPPRWYEHSLMIGARLENFVCPEKTNPHSDEKCPLCEVAERVSLVAAFTIIDHRSYKSSKGETYSNSRRLFVAKTQTFEILNKMAVKRGGLAGCTFDVSRSGEKSPGVGNVFDFTEKTPIEALQGLYTTVSTDPKTNAKSQTTYFLPADYETEIVYRSADELRKLGFGAPKGASSSFNNLSAPASTSTSTKQDYSDKM